MEDRKASPFKHMETRLFPLLEECVIQPYQNGAIPYDWTNNNCESMNHILKEVTDQKTNEFSVFN